MSPRRRRGEIEHRRRPAADAHDVDAAHRQARRPARLRVRARSAARHSRPRRAGRPPRQASREDPAEGLRVGGEERRRRRCRECRIRAGSSDRTDAASPRMVSDRFCRMRRNSAPSVGLGEPERDIGLEIAELVAAIEAPCRRSAARERAAPAAISAASPSVSWISLPAPGFDRGEMLEDLGLEDVAADDRQRRRRRCRVGLLDDALGAHQVARRSSTTSSMP